tara:strand:- start:635 stop:1087 length:453 start_codon:yes stop_codon:yes gene_type:complete
MKRILILLLLIFVYSCGYTSFYGEVKSDLNINVLSMEGDFEINNFIKNNLKISSKKDSSNTHDVILKSNYKKIVLAKNAKGEATDYNLEMSVKFIIISSNNKNLEFKENFKIKKNDDNFEQSNYEKDIKRNFSKTVEEKLILNLIKISDS